MRTRPIAKALPTLALIALTLISLTLAACSPNSSDRGTPVTTLEQIEGTWSATPERGITMIIGADGSLSGLKVCTPYLSGLTLDPATSELTFEEFVSDSPSCGETGDSDWDDFQDATAGAVTATVIDHELVLNAGTNREIRFVSEPYSTD